MNGDGFSSFDQMRVVAVIDNMEIPISHDDLMYRGRRHQYDTYFSYYGWWFYGPRICPNCGAVHKFWDSARTKGEMLSRIAQTEDEIRAADKKRATLDYIKKP